MATHSSILAWEIPWTESLACCSPWGHKRVGQDLVTRKQQRFSLKAYRKIYISFEKKID